MIRMLYADSRLNLSRQLEAYLAALAEKGDPNAAIVVRSITYIPPGRSSAEGNLANTPLGLLVVTERVFTANGASKNAMGGSLL